MTATTYPKHAMRFVFAAVIVALVLIAASLLIARRFPVAKSLQSPAGVEQEIPALTVERAQRMVAFPLPVPTYLPPGLVVGGSHVRPPNWAALFYVESDGGSGGLSVEKSIGLPQGEYAFPHDARVLVEVGENSGFYVQGSWDEHLSWHAEADANFLQWTTTDETYR